MSAHDKNEADNVTRFVEPKLVEVDPRSHFATNRIRTTKYRLWTFVPICLMRQFLKFANFYFLVCCTLQCIPTISPLQPITAILPLSFVLCLSLIREGSEDLARSKEDTRINKQAAAVRRGDRWAEGGECQWVDVQVGDVILVRSNETFPADCLLVQSSKSGGLAHIQTASLDGETNLKPRNSVVASLFSGNSPSQKSDTGQEEALVDALLAESTEELRMKITAEAPKGSLDEFDGLLENEFRGEAQAVPLTIKQFIPREAVLKNTEWVVAVVLYTGVDTKVMLGQEKAPYKMSKIDHLISKLVLLVLCIQLLMCGSGAGISAYYQADRYVNGDPTKVRMWYLGKFHERTPAAVGIINFFTFILLLNTLIPISLLVTVEITKWLQTFLIEYDRRMIWRYIDSRTEEKVKVRCKCRTSALNEDLGAVGYIFSDKTGTLTSNELRFRACMLGRSLYGEVGGDPSGGFHRAGALGQTMIRKRLSSRASGETALLPAEDAPKHFGDLAFMKDLYGTDKKPLESKVDVSDGEGVLVLDSQHALLSEFGWLLALCHEVSPETENGRLSYAGESPDEVCLVETAKDIGFTLRERSQRGLVVEHMGRAEKWDILYTVPFTNKRKRSTIVCARRGDRSTIRVFTKGADDVMMTLVKPIFPEQMKVVEHQVDFYSRQGLRTLICGVRAMSGQVYSVWARKMEKAELISPVATNPSREEAMTQLVDELEQGESLLACTATEDRLQDGVPQVIERLRSAGIVVWMITGDKRGTAIEIARSCRLIDASMSITIVDASLEPDPAETGRQYTADALAAAAAAEAEPGVARALVISGKSLEFVFEEEELKDSMRSFALTCKSIVCCRTTKEQKAQVVALVKDHVISEKLCLAIGDGANDVPMIKKAHIGVGLFGKEGRQAVQNSDYAIAQFAHLDRLLLYHGRLSYVRIAKLVLYFFYKNLAFTLPQWIFGFYNGMSGTTWYDDFYVSAFNMLFTSLPVFVLGTMEKDCDPGDCLHDLAPDNGITARSMRQSYPKLYYTGLENRFFKAGPVALMVVFGVGSGVLAFLTAVQVLWFQPALADGKGPGEQFLMSMICYSAIVISDTIALFTLCDSVSIPMIVFIVFSMFMYASFFMVCGVYTGTRTHSVNTTLMQSPLFYTATCVVVGASFMPLLMASTLYKRYSWSIRSLWLRARGFGRRSRQKTQDGDYDHDHTHEETERDLEAHLVKDDDADDAYSVTSGLSVDLAGDNEYLSDGELRDTRVRKFDQVKRRTLLARQSVLRGQIPRPHSDP